jgi:pyrophosphatase PpaX
MVKAILFDFDGTLANTLPLYVKVYERALKKFGFDFSDKKIVRECFGKTEETICKNLGIPDKSKGFSSLYFSGVDDCFNDAQLFDGVLETLKLAKEKGIKLAVVSFAYRWYVDRMLSLLDLSKYFELVIGFENVENPKPDPEAVLTACEKLNIDPQNSVVIGDSKSDMMMGNSAGTQTILFHPENYNLFYDLKTLKSSKPNNIAPDFDRIRKILNLD